MTDRLLNLFATSEQGNVAGDFLAPFLMVIGIIMLGVIMTISIRGKIARRQAETPSPREQIDAIKSRARERGVIEQTQVQLVEFAQQIAAQLDNKAQRLEQLIEEAERIADRLDGPIRDRPHHESAQSSSSYSEDAPSIAAHPTKSNDVRDPLAREIYQLADEGHSPLDIARRLDEQVGKIELILALRDSS